MPGTVRAHIARNWTPEIGASIVGFVTEDHVMSHIRRTVSLVGFCTVAIVIGTPLGCLPEIPQMPAAELPASPEIPAAPELTVPEFTPPEITPPEGPELPAQPPVSVGNCCIRTGKLLKDKCGAASSCCTDQFEDEGDCEDNRGYWFFTPEGCAGAC